MFDVSIISDFRIATGDVHVIRYRCDITMEYGR